MYCMVVRFDKVLFSFIYFCFWYAVFYTVDPMEHYRKYGYELLFLIILTSNLNIVCLIRSAVDT